MRKVERADIVDYVTYERGAARRRGSGRWR
jgi:hypothetical protein